MKTLTIVAGLAAMAALSGPAQADYYLDCSSRDYAYTYCPADTRHGVEIAEQKSSTPCTLGSSWGYDAGGVWVDGGCRGRFIVFESRSAPRRPAPAASDAEVILREVIADGTMEELEADDELSGRPPGYGAADAVEACAIAADARETARGAASIYFESVDQIVPRARRTFDVAFTMVVESRNRRARRFEGQCRVQNGQVTSYARQ